MKPLPVSRLTVGAVDTPLGALLLVVDAEGCLRAADFADCEARLHALLRRRFADGDRELVPGEVPDTIRQAFAAYFTGGLAAIDQIVLHSGGTAFQRMVWSALRALEPGRPVTYAALAQELGRPRSARAVGHANGANPFSIVVPCHRLVGADGGLTGYAGGLARKRWLLDHEARHAHGA